MTIRQISFSAIFLLLLTTGFIANVSAQRNPKAPALAKLEKPKISSNASIGDQFFSNGEYALAADYYQRALRAKSGDMYAQYRLGEAYENMFDYSRAESAYQRVVQSRAKGFPIAQYRWAMLMKINGKYEQAKKEFENFVSTFKPSIPEEQPYIDQSKVELAGCELAVKEMTIRQPEYLLQVMPAPVNSLQSEYAPALGENDSIILLTSNRPDARGSQKDPVLGGRFSDFFQFSKLGTDWKRTFPSTTFEKINSKQSEGAGVYTADKLKFYYTSCGGESQCQIFMTQMVNGNWTPPIALNANINQSGFSSKQPSISPKADTMFFVSNRPGGLGETDIYYSINRGNENWDIPVNLGAPVNSMYKDMSPCYYAKEHLLFFASNGREGLGGFDIFCATGRDFDKSQNIGIPFNGNRDDFYFIQGPKYGYLASNRENGMGSDDIYTFEPFNVAPTLREAILEKDKLAAKRPVVEVKKTTDSSLTVTAKVVDPVTKTPVEGKEVDLVDKDGNKIKGGKSDKDGNVAFKNLPTDREYDVKNGGKKGRKKGGKNGDGSGDEDSDAVVKNSKKGKGGKKGDGTGDEDSEAIVKNIKKVKTNKPATKFLFENIYFDFDKSELRPEATKALDELVTYCNEHNDAQIELDGFTDNIGSTAYNKELAGRRADATRAYLESKGLASTKVVTKAFGEQNFLSGNRNLTGRQLNRRVELQILGSTKMKGSQVFITEQSTKVADVAARFGMTVEELRSLNNITDDDVNPYQPIRVKRSGNGPVSGATMATGNSSK